MRNGTGRGIVSEVNAIHRAEVDRRARAVEFAADTKMLVAGKRQFLITLGWRGEVIRLGVRHQLATPFQRTSDAAGRTNLFIIMFTDEIETSRFNSHKLGHIRIFGKSV